MGEVPSRGVISGCFGLMARFSWVYFRTPVCGLSRGFVSWAGDKVPVFTGTTKGEWRQGAWLAVFPVGGWFVDAVEEDEGTGPAEVVEVGGEDFDAVLVGQRVDGAEEGVEGAVFLDEFEDALGVGDGGLDLAAVADEAWVGLEAFEVGGAVVGDFAMSKRWKASWKRGHLSLMTRQLKPERKMALVSSSR